MPSRGGKRNAPEWSQCKSMNLAMKTRLLALTALTYQTQNEILKRILGGEPLKLKSVNIIT